MEMEMKICIVVGKCTIVFGRDRRGRIELRTIS